MTARGTQTIGWDVENRVTSVAGGAGYLYACPERSRRNGDGNRVKKLVPYRDTGTEGGQTILYVNQYYEKPVLSVAEGNLGTGVVTTSYYLGGKLIAQREGTTLRYVHQDSLSSTSAMSTSTGTLDSSMNFFPFGSARSGDVNTEKKFTGQRLDDTGLYFYNARYYDAGIGRFISPDTIVPNPANPQSLNRYSYVLNNPLKYTDPTGHLYIDADGDGFPDEDMPVRSLEAPKSSPYLYIKPPQPQLPLEPKQSVPPWPCFDNSPLKAAVVPIGILVADDATGVGVIDDVAIIIIGGIAIGSWIGANWDSIGQATERISYNVRNWCDSLTLAKSPAEYDKHREKLDDARTALGELERRLAGATSPKERKEIRKEMNKLDRQIRGHEKEIRQKYPNGRPSK
jgi:RHS repeat-associated protein